MPGPGGQLKIEDYALLGDTRTAALVSREGSVDWMCVPRFDSAACFAALLGGPQHGRFLLTVRGRPRGVERRYRDGTLVLETTYETDEGVVVVIDAMPPGSALPELVRLVVGRSGRVPMWVELTPRFDYGRSPAWVERRPGEVIGVCGPDTLRLSTPIATRDEDGAERAEFVVPEGHTVPFTLTWFPSHAPEPPHLDPIHQVSDVERWWRAWSNRCSHQGDWREPVRRSLITLKALTYAPTGGSSPRPRPPSPRHLEACGTGTTATAGCATPCSRSRRSTRGATRRRRSPGGNGCCALWRASRRRCRSSTAPPVSGD